MNTLDDLLTGAAQRLDDATAGVCVPASAPKPSRPTGRILTAAACVVVLVGGIVAIRARDHHVQRPVTYPPGLLDGANGPEITLAEVPDGDADPATWKLQATPTGGTVTSTGGAGATATSAAATAPAVAATELPGAVGGTAPPRTDPSTGATTGGTGDTVPGGTADPASCLTLDDGSGYCPADGDPPLLFLGNRGPAGQAIVNGLPGRTFAVTFRSGGVQFWERPMHGVALFPYTEDAGTTATFAAIDVDGTLLAGDSQTNAMMTDAEIAAAVVTSTTDETLAGGWYVDIPADAPRTNPVLRRVGRTMPFGFQGPFADQSYVAAPYAANRWVDVLTVRTADLAAVEQRLAAPGRSVRWTGQVSAGVTVLIVADDAVPATEVDRAVSTLQEREPDPNSLDLDRPFSFSSPSIRGSLVGTNGSLPAMLSDAVATIADGRQVRATSDDVGDVRLTVLVDGSNWMAIDAGPHAIDQRGVQYLPAAGDDLSGGIWAVPADIVGIRLTLDDGSVLTPELVDVTSVADLKLLVVTDDHGPHRITDVDIQRG